MRGCERCGRPMSETARFCGHCGYVVREGHGGQRGPVGQDDRVGSAGLRAPGSPLAIAVVVAVVVLVACGGLVVWLLTGRNDLAGDDTALSPADPSQPTSPAVAAPSSLPATPAYPISPTYAAPGSGATPAALAAADRPRVTALNGWWVPQLSSKRVGMVVDGITYTEARIAEHVQELKAAYPGALVLDSSDYSSFGSSGLWVVVLGVPYGSAEGANGWCDASGIGPDDCFAKRLAQDGPDGNTVHR